MGDKLGLRNNKTFHTQPRSGSMKDRGERAILVQTTQTYAELRKAFPLLESIGDGSTPTFGETFVVDGFSGKDVCVGDVFTSTCSSLILQVASTRYGCLRVDKKHPVGMNLPSGKQGTVRHF